ncbi:MAG TPA: AAA family ATPase [Solirubrobacteraceae bacterium]|jgi:chromosome segregation protein|nr:AAA family ATPase [Solirubrobacteraceae bacterium]
MYLKSITVKGFKSFPDRTKMDFGPGVSVIVGPNGSGKSNVTDAVLWALGEQSPGAIRGQSMQDVIFGGAPGRQAAGHAEVELTLDDSEGSLGLGVPEISIYRKLDRAGEGEYRLAGARCRLVDIVELLSDTGLGKEMHSVISQGRVESLVTSKPRDRRLLIEEAAGLGKHRKRRRRAQLKLARTQDNLDRALDVEREARSRLRPLKRQAEAAELHERLERQSLEIRWELARDDARGYRAAMASAEATATEVRERRRTLQAELEAVAKRREAAEEALSARSAQREELSRRAYAARGAAERIGYRAESARAAATSVEGRLARYRESEAALAAEAAADVQDPEAAGRILGLEESLAELDRDREAKLARQLAELEEQLTAAGGRVAEQSEAVAEAQAEREAAEAAAEQVRGEVRDAERAVEAARREAARVGGELAAVNQFLRHHAGAPHGAAALADDLDVDSGYELAVAAALDGRLRAAVVDDRPAATTLLDRAGADGGRTLVVDDDTGAVGADGDDVAAQPPAPGAARLVEHVRAQGRALALARALLRDTWVVEDLDQVAAGFRGVAVTRGGRVWSARTRELRQAPAVGEERVLAERNRREQLIAESERAAQAEVDARAGVQRATAGMSEADSVRDRLTNAHRGAVRALDERREEARRITALIERRRAAPDDGVGGDGFDRCAQIASELAAERRMLERVERERTERARRLERVRAGLANHNRLVPAVASVIAALQDAAGAIAQRLESFDEALASDRQAGEHVALELRTCAQQEAELHAKISQENETLTQAEVRLQRARDQAGDAEAELGRIAQRLELAAEPAEEALTDEERQTLDARLERVARRREQLGPVNPLAQEEYAEAVAHVEELETQRADLETALRELEKLIADTDKQIRITFEQTFAATASAFEELAGQLFPGGEGRLRLVSERDGPARVIGGQQAPEDGDSEGEDADDASGEEDLEPEEDLLGVEIEITPAGKECKRLSLLSGGEKSMTALAFLFAVFLARPCPFYILDEVEAALDDLNIDRFLALLRQYSSRAQFIVVTHQKRTMEAADSLYGVSMGSDGISKVISRKLSSAEGPTDAATEVAAA